MRIPDPARRPLIFVYNRWLAFRASRERSVKNVARRNTRKAFQQIYGSPELVEEYLADERLSFYEEIAERCARFTPRRVIDVGCGTGHLLAAVIRCSPSVETVVGVDYAESAVDRLAETVPRARGYVASIYDPGLGEERFDLVLCTEVLEHVDRPSEALRSLVRLCEPGGQIVVTVPDGERDDWEGHANFWSASELEVFLGSAGMVEVVRTQSDDLLGIVRP